MKTLMLVLLGVLCFFNKTVAQDSSPSFLAGWWETLQSKKAGGGFEVQDTGKIYLFFGKERKPLVSLQADFSKSTAWLDFTVKDTAGNVRLQSLLQVIDDRMIQWQFFDSTRTHHSTSAEGEIFFQRSKQ